MLGFLDTWPSVAGCSEGKAVHNKGGQMGLIITDQTGHTHRIDDIEDPKLIEILRGFKAQLDRLIQEKNQLTRQLVQQSLDLDLQNRFAELEMRDKDQKLNQLQDLIDASINHLD